jgi:hypothetical protein
MKKYYVLITMFTLFVVQTTTASDDWSNEDYYRHAAVTTLKAIDFLQTMKIARDPQNYHEKNPILGRHPSETDVELYFIGTYAAQTALVYFLPSDYRTWAQYLFIGLSGACVINNFSIGLGFGF